MPVVALCCVVQGFEGTCANQCLYCAVMLYSQHTPTDLNVYAPLLHLPRHVELLEDGWLQGLALLCEWC